MRGETVRVLKVFIASPSDVNAERRAAVRAIGWVNDHLAKRAGYRLEPLTWERDVLPDTGPDVQSVINDQIGQMERVAVFLLIMRDKFGSPTPRYGSGTEEEYERAVEARRRKRGPKNPHLLLCFGRPTAKADPAQQKKVETFKARVGGPTMYRPFTTTADFERQVREFLTAWTTERLVRTTERTGKNLPEKPLTSGNAMLLGDRVYRAGRPKEEHGRLITKIEVRSPAEERALRTLGEGYGAVPYAYGLTGGMVRVSRVEAAGERERSVAFVTFDAPQTGANVGFAYGRDDGDREAAIRRVLLGETTLRREGGAEVTLREDGPKAVVPPILAKSKEPAARLEARLRAVQALFQTGLVKEITRLTIGAPTDKGIKLSFKGRVRTGWSGEADAVCVEGTVGAPKRRAAPKAKPKEKTA